MTPWSLLSILLIFDLPHTSLQVKPVWKTPIAVPRTKDVSRNQRALSNPYSSAVNEASPYYTRFEDFKVPDYRPASPFNGNQQQQRFTTGNEFSGIHPGQAVRKSGTFTPLSFLEKHPNAAPLNHGGPYFIGGGPAQNNHLPYPPLDTVRPYHPEPSDTVSPVSYHPQQPTGPHSFVPPNQVPPSNSYWPGGFVPPHAIPYWLGPGPIPPQGAYGPTRRPATTTAEPMSPAVNPESYTGSPYNNPSYSGNSNEKEKSRNPYDTKSGEDSGRERGAHASAYSSEAPETTSPESSEITISRHDGYQQSSSETSSSRRVENPFDDITTEEPVTFSPYENLNADESLATVSTVLAEVEGVTDSTSTYGPSADLAAGRGPISESGSRYGSTSDSGSKDGPDDDGYTVPTLNYGDADRNGPGTVGYRAGSSPNTGQPNSYNSRYPNAEYPGAAGDGSSRTPNSRYPDSYASGHRGDQTSGSTDEPGSRGPGGFNDGNQEGSTDGYPDHSNGGQPGKNSVQGGLNPSYSGGPITTKGAVDEGAINSPAPTRGDLHTSGYGSDHVDNHTPYVPPNGKFDDDDEHELSKIDIADYYETGGRGVSPAAQHEIEVQPSTVRDRESFENGQFSSPGYVPNAEQQPQPGDGRLPQGPQVPEYIAKPVQAQSYQPPGENDEFTKNIDVNFVKPARNCNGPLCNIDKEKVSLYSADKGNGPTLVISNEAKDVVARTGYVPPPGRPIDNYYQKQPSTPGAAYSNSYEQQSTPPYIDESDETQTPVASVPEQRFIPFVPGRGKNDRNQIETTTFRAQVSRGGNGAHVFMPPQNFPGQEREFSLTKVPPSRIDHESTLGYSPTAKTLPPAPTTPSPQREASTRSSNKFTQKSPSLDNDRTIPPVETPYDEGTEPPMFGGQHSSFSPTYKPVTQAGERGDVVSSVTTRPVQEAMERMAPTTTARTGYQADGRTSSRPNSSSGGSLQITSPSFDETGLRTDAHRTNSPSQSSGSSSASTFQQNRPQSSSTTAKTSSEESSTVYDVYDEDSSEEEYSTVYEEEEPTRPPSVDSQERSSKFSTRNTPKDSEVEASTRPTYGVDEHHRPTSRPNGPSPPGHQPQNNGPPGRETINGYPRAPPSYGDDDRQTTPYYAVHVETSAQPYGGRPTTSTPPPVVANRIRGKAHVVCKQDGIEFRAHTLFPFTGQIFANERKRIPECLHELSNVTEPTVFLPFEQCGVRNAGEENDNRTQYHLQVVVVLEQNDGTSTIQSFMAQCVHQKIFYTKQTLPRRIEEALEELQLVSSRLEQKAPLPQVEMKIVVDNHHELGNEVSEVDIGMPLAVQWKLVPESDAYGFLVRNCKVVDTISGMEHRLVDEHGCSTDLSIIHHPHYDTYHDTASAHMWAFKVPDHTKLRIKCDVLICSDIPSSSGNNASSCASIPSPPFCPDLITSPSNSILYDAEGAYSKRRREIASNSVEYTQSVRVALCTGANCGEEAAALSLPLCMDVRWISGTMGFSLATLSMAIAVNVAVRVKIAVTSFTLELEQDVVVGKLIARFGLRHARASRYSCIGASEEHAMAALPYLVYVSNMFPQAQYQQLAVQIHRADGTLRYWPLTENGLLSLAVVAYSILSGRRIRPGVAILCGLSLTDGGIVSIAQESLAAHIQTANGNEMREMFLAPTMRGFGERFEISKSIHYHYPANFTALINLVLL